MSTYPTPAAARSAAITPLNLKKLTAIFRGGSSAAVVDAIWVPAVAATLIILAGAIGYWQKLPLLFAGLGPTVLMLASNPGHETTRPRAVVISHLAAIGCGYLALLLLNAHIATAVITRATVPMPRVWASAVALGMLGVLMPQLRAYHPPAAATALLVTLGAYRMTGKTPLALMGGVIAVVVIAELLNRVRPKRGR